MRRTLAPLGSISEEVEEIRNKRNIQRYLSTQENDIEKKKNVQDVDNEPTTRKKKSHSKRSTTEDTPESCQDLQKSIYGMELSTPVEIEPMKRRKARKPKRDENFVETQESLSSEREEKPEDKKKSSRRKAEKEVQQQNEAQGEQVLAQGEYRQPKEKKISDRKKDMTDQYEKVVSEQKGTQVFQEHEKEPIDDVLNSSHTPIPQQVKELQRVKTPVLSSVYGSIYQKQHREQRREEKQLLQEQENLSPQPGRDNSTPKYDNSPQLRDTKENISVEKVRKNRTPKQENLNDVGKVKTEKLQSSHRTDRDVTHMTLLQKNNFFNGNGAIDNGDDNLTAPTSSTKEQISPWHQMTPTLSSTIDMIKSFLRKSQNLLSTGRFVDYNQHPDIEAEKHALFRQNNFIERKENLVMMVEVHGSDPFKLSTNAVHPIVKVSVLDSSTGLLLSSATSKDENRSEYVLPIITKPFDVRKKKSVLPTWDDKLYFDHNYYRFLRDNVIFIFEILDFAIGSGSPGGIVAASGDRKHGVFQIAWGFLKCVSSSGRSNTESKVRLQLYRYPSNSIENIRRITKPFSKSFSPAESESNLLATSRKLFHLYSSREKAKIYPSSLYVTLKAFERQPQQLVQYPNRPLELNQVETGRFSLQQLLDARVAPLTSGVNEETAQKRIEEEKKRQELEKRRRKATRKRNEKCEIPSKFLCRIDTARGCIVIRFSHCGRYLACGSGSVVKVCDIWNNGSLEYEFVGHVGIVYELNWSADDETLLSTSSDGTVRVWRCKSADKRVLALQHPCYVYSASFHPEDAKLIITGAYDGKIRVWLLAQDGLSGELLKEISGHSVRVNSICFNSDGSRIYSADGSGIIKVWNSGLTDDRRSYGESLTLMKTIEDEEITRASLTCIRVDPRNSNDRLLIHTQDNMIRRLDVSTRAIRCRYSGVKCFLNAQKSNLSPDGRFVVSGSDNGTIFFWNAETGDLIDKEGKDYGFEKASVYDIAWSSQEHVIALCSYDNQPVRVYYYEKKIVEVDERETENDSLSVATLRIATKRPTSAASTVSSHWSRGMLQSPLARPKTPPPSSFLPRPETSSGLMRPKTPPIVSPQRYMSPQYRLLSPNNSVTEDNETKLESFDEIIARYTEAFISND